MLLDGLRLLLSIAMCGSLLISTSPHAISPMSNFEGRVLSCNVEGEKIHTNISNGHCFECVCQSKTAVCQKKLCPDLSTCPVRAMKKAVDCCEKCQTCSYLGQSYENDEQWFSDQDSCRRFTCKAGVITEGSIDCVTPCKYPIRKPGFCCSVCPESEGTKSVAKNDPCITCQCEKLKPLFWSSNAISFISNRERKLHELSYCHCFRTPCPVLDCHPELQYTPKGSCCPECREYTTAVSLIDGCTFRGETKPNLKHFRPELCLFCTCQDGSVICTRFKCNLPNCTANRLYHRDDLCCPLCMDSDPLPCKYGEKEYQHGESWDINSCTQCQCRNSQINCTTVQCPFSQGCPKGYRRMPAPKGQCCQTCKEYEATCTVYGDPHYQTFDGREYNFQGSCKYVLAKSCKRSSPVEFMVVVKNEMRGSNWSTWTRQVSIKFDGFRIVLMQGKRIKINKKVLTQPLPFVELGKFKLISDGRQNNVVFKSVDGVQVAWDGRSLAELTLTSAHRKSVCGLCGNYNGDPADDFVKQPPFHLRRSALASPPATWLTKNIDEFGKSWRIGSWKKCHNPADRKFHRREDKIRWQAERSVANGFYESSDFHSDPFSPLAETRRRDAHKIRASDVVLSNSIASMSEYVEDRRQHDRVAPAESFFSLRPSPRKLDVDSPFHYLNGPMENERAYGYDFAKANAVAILATASNRIATLNAFSRDVDSMAHSDSFILAENRLSGYRIEKRGDYVSDNASLAARRNTGGMRRRGDVVNVRRRKRRRRRRLRDAMKVCARQNEPRRWNPVKRKCKMLRSPLFEECRGLVNVWSYYRSCIMDVCSCPPTANCYCDVFAAYARKCGSRTLTVDWRIEVGCPLDSDCPVKGSVFESCPAPCPPITCENHNDRSINGYLIKSCYKEHALRLSRGTLRAKNLICLPACRCPEGSVLLKSENRCVPPKDCIA